MTAIKLGEDLNRARMSADRKKDQFRRINWSVGFAAAICLLLAITEGVINFWIVFGACMVFLAVRLIIHLTREKNDDPYSTSQYKKK
jgi:large-conductance mechanosensitive channel